MVSYTMTNLSKRRQSELVSFFSTILYIVYATHVLACTWIYIGDQESCETHGNKESHCTPSWLYYDFGDYYFNNKGKASVYLFSLYYMFEVITTVGYGDYAGHTTNEFLFIMGVEFIGLIVFSFLMNGVSTVM